MADNLVKEKITEYEQSFTPDDNWEEYLQVLNENRMNREFIPEHLFQEYQQKITTEYLQKYPYLKRYNLGIIC